MQVADLVRLAMVKPDIKLVNQVARRFGIDRDDFGDYIHECKRAGDYGSRNARGDFTLAELEEKAREYIELHKDD